MVPSCRRRHFDIEEAAAYDEAASRRHGDWNYLNESLLLLRPAGERSALNITVSWSRAFLPDSRYSRKGTAGNGRSDRSAHGDRPTLRSM